jgi:hypothetical protein
MLLATLQINAYDLLRMRLYLLSTAAALADQQRAAAALADQQRPPAAALADQQRPPAAALADQQRAAAALADQLASGVLSCSKTTFFVQVKWPY